MRLQHEHRSGGHTFGVEAEHQWHPCLVVGGDSHSRRNAEVQIEGSVVVDEPCDRAQLVVRHRLELVPLHHDRELQDGSLAQAGVRRVEAFPRFGSAELLLALTDVVLANLRVVFQGGDPGGLGPEAIEGGLIGSALLSVLLLGGQLRTSETSPLTRRATPQRVHFLDGREFGNEAGEGVGRRLGGGGCGLNRFGHDNLLLGYSAYYIRLRMHPHQVFFRADLTFRANHSGLFLS